MGTYAAGTDVPVSRSRDEMGGWPVRRPTTIHEDSQED